MPTAKANPARDITLIESPNAAKATNVPITDTGMASIMTRVGLKLLKNNISTQIAKIPPKKMFCLTSEIAELIYTVSSYTFSSTKPFL